MRVWIDHNLCTGDGICAQLCPSVFKMMDDGLAYVIDEVVTDENYDAVQESIEECPGECIFLEEEND